jgi:membrane protein YqaA with SNARE-associated domain
MISGVGARLAQRTKRPVTVVLFVTALAGNSSIAAQNKELWEEHQDRLLRCSEPLRPPECSIEFMTGGRILSDCDKVDCGPVASRSCGRRAALPYGAGIQAHRLFSGPSGPARPGRSPIADSDGFMIRRLYDWTMSFARTRHAERALAGVSFIESSFFPIPPDALLIPMVLAERLRWLRYALVCTIASVLGALLGYVIGAWLFDAIGRPILAFYGKEDSFTQVADWYNTWGGWGVLFAAVTPFPYKVLTIFSGATGLNLVTFVIVSIIGRGFRFFLVAWLLYRIGEPIRLFIEKHLGLLFTAFMVLLIGGFVAIRYMF